MYFNTKIKFVMKKNLILFFCLVIVSFVFGKVADKKLIASPNKKNDKSVTLNQTEILDPIFLENIYLLHNDGCYYLGKVYLMDDGSLAWYNLYGDTSYTGTTVFCMSQEEFSNFC